MKSSLKIIDENLLAELSQQAALNPRLRQNYNLHETLDDPCQRVINAVVPGSYIRPHRHLLTPKPELFVAISGKVALLIFSNTGDMDKAYILGTASPVRAVDVPVGVWHTAISLEKGAVFLEVKPGPYVPVSASDFAPWAPEPETPEAVVYLQKLEDALRDYKRF